MPFADIACHVWAIDGYTDDDAAKVADNAYVKCANALRTTNSADSRRQALAALLAAARAAAGTATKARLYGGFRRGQKAPEHMWIEYNDHIYDTMPGYGLCRADASAKYRSCPGLENEDFGDGAVYIEMSLTPSQVALIDAGVFIAPVH